MAPYVHIQGTSVLGHYMEVLSIFELDWALVDFHQGGSIRFQMFWEQWSLSYTEFALLLGIFDIDFNNTQ